MKIANISFFNSYKLNSIKEKNINNKIEQKPNTYAKFPTTNEYLAFLGYSGNLKKTYEHLTFEECPFQIYNAILNELSRNNPCDKTLYDIHFEKYRNILDYYSLDDLKADFPEFKNVVSAYDVEAEPDSAIGEFQNNVSEVFTSEEDLTLQLIKLYWGQGFSLNDLSDFVAQHSSDNQGKNLHYAMRKLNIPRMQSKYAHVLKFSNRNYYKNYSEQMKIKLAEAREAKEQKAQGEPVVIPKGTLSEAHKKHISESLKKYYQENPIAIYNQSERQKKFYEENPQAKEEISMAMDYAWNRTQEGKNLKKSLIKFMKKYGNIQENQLLTGDVSFEQKTGLALFWSKNSWAKEKFAQAAKQGWEYAKVDIDQLFNGENIPNRRITLHTVPTAYNQKITAWAKNNNMEQCCHWYNSILYDTEVGKGNIVQKRAMDEIKKISKTIEKFAQAFPQEGAKLANARLGAIYDFMIALQDNLCNLPESIKNNSIARIAIYEKLKGFSENILYKKINEKTTIKMAGVDNNYLISVLNKLTEELFIHGCYDVTDYFIELLDNNYSDSPLQNEIMI